MEWKLDRLWNGQPAPKGLGGSVHLRLKDAWLELGWNVEVLEEPRAPDVDAGFADGLWEWDVIEVFAQGKDKRYVEFEFGPSAHWLGLAFSDVRQRASDLRDFPLQRSIQVRDMHWRGQVLIRLAELCDWLGSDPVRGVVTAHLSSRLMSVVPFPGEKPDFHQPAVWPSLRR